MRRIVISHEDVIGRAFMLFVQTSRAVAKKSDNHFLKSLHLSTVKYLVLKALSLSGGTLTHGDLANWTGTERNNITALVARLQKEELVTSERSVKDKRFVNVILTEKGRDLLGQANQVAQDIVDQLMEGIDKLKAAQLERLMMLLQKNI